MIDYCRHVAIMHGRTSFLPCSRACVSLKLTKLYTDHAHQHSGAISSWVDHGAISPWAVSLSVTMRHHFRIILEFALIMYPLKASMILTSNLSRSLQSCGTRGLSWSLLHIQEWKSEGFHIVGPNLLDTLIFAVTGSNSSQPMIACRFKRTQQ
jgi:hypothetical protein